MKKIYLIALLTSIITGFLFFTYMKGLEKNAEIQYDELICAVVDIPRFTQITPEHLKIVKIPRTDSSYSIAKTKEEVLGKFYEHNINAGEFIYPQDLKQDKDLSSGFSYMIPVGMRAITIVTDDVAGVAGNIVVGDRVDLIVTLPITVPKADDLYNQISNTGYVVADVEVIDVGTVKQNDEGYLYYETITLCVNPTDAINVTHATIDNPYRLVLRNKKDREDVPNTIIDNDNIIPKG